MKTCKPYMITSRQTVCIFTLKRNLDLELIYGLLSLHALSGCDTTSRPYGIWFRLLLSQKVVNLGKQLHQKLLRFFGVH